jgi:thiol-disulfide isomerase/thioredoxin/tetratricopeptide (TPR) repeat protein
MKIISLLLLAFLLVIPACFFPALAQENNQAPRNEKAKELEDQANQFLQQRKNSEAIAAFEEAIKIEPQRSSLHFGLGVAYSNRFFSTRNKEFEEKAIAELRKSLELNPAQAGAQLAMGKMAFTAKRYEEAITLAEREIKANPSDAFAYKLKWEAMLKREDFEKEVPVIRAEIESLLQNNARRQDALVAALFGHEVLADDDARSRIEDLILKECPASLTAKNIFRDRAMVERDKKKQTALIEDFITRFPDDPTIAVMYPAYFRGLASRPDEPGEKIAKTGVAWVKAVSEIYEVITSRWTVALTLAERRADLGLAASIIDEAVKITDSLDAQSASLSRVREDARPRFIAMLKERAHTASGFVLLRRGKIEEASKELASNLQPVIEQVEKNGYILWKDMDLREIGVRPRVLWLAELYEAQGDFERARKYLLAGVSDDEQANSYIRERLPVVFSKLGRDSSAAASALKDAESRYNTLTAASPGNRDEQKKRALAKRVAKPAPDFKVLTVDKKVVRLSDLRGKVVVLNFWATWCGPCIEEMPHLEKAFLKYKNEPRVVFLAVSVDDNKLAVRSFLQKKRYTMLTAYDDGAAQSFGVSGIPTTFFIDRNGTIQFDEQGFGGDGSEYYVERMSWRIDDLLNSTR